MSRKEELRNNKEVMDGINQIKKMRISNDFIQTLDDLVSVLYSDKPEDGGMEYSYAEDLYLRLKFEDYLSAEQKVYIKSVLAWFF